MKNILVTGGAGFVGTHLIARLLKEKNTRIVVFDKLDKYPEEKIVKDIIYQKGNIVNEGDVVELFEKYGPFDDIYHLAAEMPNKLADEKLMFATNVDGTSYLVRQAVKWKAKSIIFTSSNVTYGIPVELPVDEDTPIHPLESYGKSKANAEKALLQYKDKINIQIFRCPVITGIGRLGLQAVLYEFISENRKVYVLGSGNNKYQFVDVDDVVSALIKASSMKGADIYAIGADEVLSLRELYQRVIDHAGSKSKIQPLPAGPAFFALTLMDKINFSPLGIYQRTMMGRSIYADTTKIKKKLGWSPKKTNAATFIDNYEWYIANKGNFSEIGGEYRFSQQECSKNGNSKNHKDFFLKK